MSNVRLISITPDAEKTMAYCARVSNPANQDNPSIAGLLRFCIRNGHWSIFEMANMVVEIKTSRAIAAQVLRHRSFSFQEFSQRYAEASSATVQDARSQDLKNRQNSNDDMDQDVKDWFVHAQRLVNNTAFDLYNQALEKGIAKECARFLLPLSTDTTLYMNGTVRSWIHYLNLRADPLHGTQKEHLDIANEVKAIFIEQLPVVAEALQWI